MDALRAGEPDAFATLVADYQRAVFTLALRLVRDREDARDITQDVFIKAYGAVPRTTGDLHLWAWLYRVTVNACWDHLRAASRRPRPAEDAEELAESRSGDETEQAEVARLFSESLAALPPRQQAALVLKDIHGLDHADIAQALGITRGSSKVLLFHARHSFRRAYTALAADDGRPAAVCRVAERAAAASVGGRLGAAERRAVLSHARDCPDCRRVVQDWQGPRAVGLALALPMVAAPHLFGVPAAGAGAFGPALAGAGAASGAGAAAAGSGAAATGAGTAATGAGAAAAGSGAAAGVSAAAGSGAASAVAAGAASAAASTGTSAASLGFTGMVAAKLAGVGVVKAAAVVVAATSIAAYGGAEAYTGHTARHAQRVAVAGAAAEARTPSPLAHSGRSAPVEKVACAAATVVAGAGRLDVRAQRRTPGWLTRQLKAASRAGAGGARLRTVTPAGLERWARRLAGEARRRAAGAGHLHGQARPERTRPGTAPRPFRHGVTQVHGAVAARLKPPKPRGATDAGAVRAGAEVAAVIKRGAAAAPSASGAPRHPAVARPGAAPSRPLQPQRPGTRTVKPPRPPATSPRATKQPRARTAAPQRSSRPKKTQDL